MAVGERRFAVARSEMPTNLSTTVWHDTCIYRIPKRQLRLSGGGANAPSAEHRKGSWNAS